MAAGFFKIICSTEPRLRLPNKFVNRYKESIPSVVSVKGPCGPAFQVELTPSGGQIWLDKGFDHFMDYFSIKPFYLLVFKCDVECSVFHVTIFDQSATEIDYPISSIMGKTKEKVCIREEIEVVSGESTECLYDVLVQNSRKEKKSKGKKKLVELHDDDDEVQILEKNTTLHDKRKKFQEVEDDVAIEILEEDSDDEVSDHCMNGNLRKRETGDLENIKTRKKGKQTVSFMSPAHERAKAFRSTRPSFVSYMHRSYIIHSVNIKKSFAMEFFKVESLCDVVLMVDGGTRTWTAKCYLGITDVKLRWRTFVKDNGLCERDACVFELINDIKPSLNVIIFRSSKDEEVKGNLRNTDLGECSRKPKTCKRMKLEKIGDTDTSKEILTKIPSLKDINL